MKDDEIKDLDEKKRNELKKKTIDNLIGENWKFSDIAKHMDMNEKELKEITEMLEHDKLVKLRDLYRTIDELQKELKTLEEKIPSYKSYGESLPVTVGKAICIKCGNPAGHDVHMENVRPPKYVFYCAKHMDELEETGDYDMIIKIRCYKTDGVSTQYKY